MDRSDKIPQLYGYAVCLICIITLLISSGQVVNALFDLADPIRSNRGWHGSGLPITSYSAYRRAHLERQAGMSARGPARTTIPTSAEQPATPPAPSDAELRQMYQDDRDEHIGSVRYQSMKSLITSLLLSILAGVLFLVHWKWLRRQSAQTA